MVSRLLLPLLSSTLKFTAHRSWWLAILIWGAAIAPARSESVDLRVAIEQNVPKVNVGASVNAKVLDGSRRPLGEIQGMNGFTAEFMKGGGISLDRWRAGAIWIEPKDKNGVVWIGNNWYRGRVYVVPTGKGLTAVNYVDLEQYLFSVLGSEMSARWPLEALKAQAVAARSYALHERQYASNGVFDLGNTQGWQVYQGISKEAVSTQQAVLSTSGQVLTHNGNIINAVFHSSAGGCTENVEDVWTRPLPYLRSVQNRFDEGQPNYQWSETVAADRLSRFGVGTVQRIEPVERTPVCGRWKRARIIGDQGQSKVVSGEELRTALGLKSTLFQIAAQFPQTASKNDTKTRPSGFVINGRGFGHGLGMSQYGALNMALRGAKYQQILGQYYVKTTLAKIDVQ
jgi:stage II sporulation protein D